MPQPQTTSQGEGVRIHDMAQRFVDQGQVDWPSHHSLRRALVDLDLSKTVYAEHPRDYEMGIWASGVPVRGRMDIIDPGNNAVIDLKSCKSFRYILTADELALDPQLGIYAKYGLVADLLTDQLPIKLTHAYVRTDGTHEHRLVTAKVGAADVETVYSGVERTVEHMQHTASAATYHDVPMNQEACADYGGCPYVATCGVVLTKPVVQSKDMSVVSLGERLKVARGINPPDANQYEVKPAAPEPEPERLDLELYVDCAPRRRSFQHLDELIAEKAGPICLAAGVTDPREVDFGKGVAALAAAFKRNPPKGVVVARSGPLSAAVVEVLAPMAREVIFPL